MRISIIGADFEENLGVGYIAASAAEAGHAVRVVPFNEASTVGKVTREVMAGRPEVVGLSMQFQHRAGEFLALAARLREAGFAGHITCGGQFPTLAWSEVLGAHHGIDSVVLHEGERTIVELLAALEGHRPLAEVPGLAIRTDDGVPLRTAGRPLGALDPLPLPLRYRPHSRHFGVPFIPLLGSRGCWGSCAYCSITSFYRDARAHGGGHTVRLRSPESIAAEMALLWHRAGGPSLFCFHDENLLLPRPSDTLERLTTIRRLLDGWGVGKIGLVGKCRPDCLTPELALQLADLGVVRLYIGVENASDRGASHLRRRTQTAHVEKALAAARAANIFGCYNLLIFEPDATVDDVRENVRFIREHADHPVNFCRAEAYYGTPLHLSLAERQTLGGSYLGWNYRLADDRAELLFRVASAAFRQRNFDPEGVANRSMGLGYAVKVLEHFHEDPEGRRPALRERALELTRGITQQTADFLDEAIALVEGGPIGPAAGPEAADRIERETGLLGLRIAAADAVWHRLIDELHADLDRFAVRAARPRRALSIPRPLVDLARKIAIGASLASAAAGCNISTVNDPVPPNLDWGSDPAPFDLGHDQRVPLDLDPVPDIFNGHDFGNDPPPDFLRSDDINIVDPPPPPTDMRFIPDIDMPPDLLHLGLRDPSLRPPSLQIIDQWRNTTPQRVVRSEDLPLFATPQLRLQALAEGDALRVTIAGGPAEIGTRWECEGALDLEGRDGDHCRELTWRPRSPDSQLRVGVRVQGGVAVLAMRARDA